ncbi:MAG: hypothetical protein ACLUFD_00005 [Faecalibacterium sp.]
MLRRSVRRCHCWQTAPLLRRRRAALDSLVLPGTSGGVCGLCPGSRRHRFFVMNEAVIVGAMEECDHLSIVHCITPCRSVVTRIAARDNIAPEMAAALNVNPGKEVLLARTRRSRMLRNDADTSLEAAA